LGNIGEAITADGWQYRMIYPEPEMLEAITGERNRWRPCAIKNWSAVS